MPYGSLLLMPLYFTIEEIWIRLQKLTIHKARDHQGIKTEMLKWMGNEDMFICALQHDMPQLVYKLDQPLYKGTDINNFNSLMAKLLECVIIQKTKRIYSYMVNLSRDLTILWFVVLLLLFPKFYGT